MKLTIPFGRKDDKPRPFASSRPPEKDIIRRIILMLVVTVAFWGMYLSLLSRGAEWINYRLPKLNEGDISPRREIAPIDFTIPKPERQLEQERRAAERNALPVFSYDDSTIIRLSARIDSLFTLLDAAHTASPDSTVLTALTSVLAGVSSATIDSLVRETRRLSPELFAQLRSAVEASFENIAELMIISSANELESVTSDRIIIDNSDTVRVEMAVELQSALELARLAFQNRVDGDIPARAIRVYTSALGYLLRPNLAFDQLLTEELRLRTRNEVSPYAYSFRRNERIIDANVPITREQAEILGGLKREIARRSFLENRLRHYFSALGKTILALGILAVIAGYVALYRRKLFASTRQIALLVVVGALPVLAGFYVARVGAVSEFLVPVALASLLAAILFDAELGILTTLSVSLIVSTFFPAEGVRVAAVGFLTGSAGVFSVRRVRHRKEFYRSMLAVPVAAAVAIIVSNDWINPPTLTDVGSDVIVGLLSGFFCPIIAIGLLPLLESTFRVTTDITLLELSDLNNPLLKRLAVEAPGTYSSVLVVGMLAEAAAEKVRANPLLARVGAYYHDIGKLTSPQYFIENQLGGANPHDKLSPHMSALILAAHVKEGCELGAKYGLPEQVLEIIAQHHGTSLMQSFYHKALEEGDGGPVDELPFRYPGPKPQTREAAIVMLADLSEAAARTVQEKSAGRLRTLINTIIQKRFMDGELDECDLTLRDLHAIEESFLPILVSSHHGRIAYPWQQEQLRHKAGQGTGAQESTQTPKPAVRYERP